MHPTPGLEEPGSNLVSRSTRGCPRRSGVGDRARRKRRREGSRGTFRRRPGVVRAPSPRLALPAPRPPQLLNTNKYGVDQNEIKEYFPLHKVVDGTLEIYQELLGLVFTEATAFEKWHDDVRLFSVRDGASGELIGHFYLDLHPRDGKYTHAAIFHLSKRTPEQVPVCVGLRPTLCFRTRVSPPTRRTRSESPLPLQIPFASLFQASEHLACLNRKTVGAEDVRPPAYINIRPQSAYATTRASVSAHPRFLFV